MKVKLFTRAGGFVARATVVPFNEAPSLLIWGERFFVFPDADAPKLEAEEDETVYVEAFAYAVQEVHP